MIQSMTGFGKAESVIENKKITVEIRSLNSKFIDISLKLPSLYREKDMQIRSQITDNLKRGKIDFYLHYDLIDQEPSQILNEEIIKKYYTSFQNIVKNISIKNADQIDFLQHIMRMPDAFKNEKKEISDTEWSSISELIKQSLKDLMHFRLNEGKALDEDLRCQIKKIISLLDNCYSFENERIQIIKERLSQNLESIRELDSYDDNRYEQEMIYYLEKLDISEEKVRLSKHCDHFIETMNETNSNGKKLGFITQEIGREINTLGSKANHSEIQKNVIQMKDHLEKIKEQVLNIV